ncbi:hypothetical protein G9P44_000206 [Scheffersomyces stipitis]|nr:hypothetical protein G9P44_000206 [Scheffersomyces stipitis]
MSLPSVYTESKHIRFAPDDTRFVLQEPVSGQSPFEMMQETLPVPEAYTKRSVPIPGTETPGYSPIYRNNAFPNGVKESIFANLRTSHDYFTASVAHHTDQPCFAYRKHDYVNNVSDPNYTILSYSEVNQMKKDFGSGLLYLLNSNPYKDASKYESHAKIDSHITNFRFFNKDNHSFILTLFSVNRWEWVLTDLMCSSFSVTSTALYDTLGPKASEFILELTDSPVIVASKNHIKTLITLKEMQPDKLGQIITIISMDPLLPRDSYLHTLARKNRISIFEFSQVLKLGKMFPQEELPPSPETLATISFTSGTTGTNPKGVMLLQKNAAASISTLLAQLPHFTRGKTLSFLPLAHISERQGTIFALTFGYCIGFQRYGGGPLTLIEDLKVWKPTYMANVPRIYTKIEAGLKNATIESESALTRAVFGKIFEYKIKAQSEKDGDKCSHIVYDLFLSKLRNSLGFDNMELLLTGSAPISADTVKFFKASLNTGMVQGYGLTETFGGCCFSLPYDKNPGSTGSISVTTELKIRELPEMGYNLNDNNGPRGELMLRGPQITPGYFKNAEETAKSFDEEGWFKTGDVAQIASDGKLYIIDRVKNFFKLAQGEYVTPEKIETLYLSNNPILTQCYTHGDSLRHYLVGVVGLDQQLAAQFLVDKCNVKPDQLQTAQEILDQCNRVDVKTQILKYLNSKIESKLQGFEKLHNIYIEFEPLRVDRNVVTPTLKLKRPIAQKFFSEPIATMYREGSLIKAGIGKL